MTSCGVRTCSHPALVALLTGCTGTLDGGTSPADDTMLTPDAGAPIVGDPDAVLTPS